MITDYLQTNKHKYISYQLIKMHSFLVWFILYRVFDFLTHVNTVGENYNFFEPGFTLDELQEVPKIYKSIIEDPLMLKEYFEQDDTGINR